MYLFAVLLQTHISAAVDSLLAEACRSYYTGDSCASVVAQIRSNLTRVLPTLEAGDPSSPPLLFIHGWPDSAAEWIHQLEHFCLPPTGRFFCVAPTLFNFHPDVPSAPDSDLFFDVQVKKIGTLVQEMGLQNITLVIHDWGSLFGYMLSYKHPDLIQRIISFDIGDICKGCAVNRTYQLENIRAYRTQNSSISQASAAYWEAPCPSCAVWRAGWPYVALYTDQNWTHRFAPEVPHDQWKFSSSPDLPVRPMLFFWYAYSSVCYCQYAK